MTNPNVLEIDDTNFDLQALRSPVPVLVDFTAAWCAPCRAIAPHVAAIADAYAGRIRVGKCDVDANREVTTRFDVRSMPTLMMFKNGRVVAQLVGAVPRARIEELVASALASSAD
jgi:thioredoxin 1